MSRARDLADGTFNKSQDAETNIELTNTNAGSSAQVRTKYTTDGGLFTVGKTSDAHVYGGDAYVYNVDNTNIRFATGDTERLRILSGGGITFNGDTAAANALDDYEEGTWTPTCENGTIGTTSGRYRKIGSMVWVGFFCSNFSDRSSSNAVVIKNLPFTPAVGNGYAASGAVFSRYVTSSFGTPPNASYVSYGNPGIYFYASSTGGYAAILQSNITSSSGQFYSEATYFV